MKMNRRSFIAGCTAQGITLALGANAENTTTERNDFPLESPPSFSPTVWFEIDARGKVLVNIAKAEMGQHIGTALARIVADELGAAWEDISIKHVDTDPKWGYMITGSSWSVFDSFTVLSQAGAAGRIILAEAGARMLGVSPEQTIVENSQVVAGDQIVSFADIVSRGDIKRTFSAEELQKLETKTPADRKFIGKPVPALDIPEKSNGQATYGIDIELPNMVFACPLIPPTRYGSEVMAIDDRNARDLPGYIKTLQIEDPSNTITAWVVVLADSFQNALAAAEKVVVDWRPGPTANISEDDLIANAKTLISDTNAGALVVNRGDTSAALEQADSTLAATYVTHTALHFTLEPMNAVVEFKGAKCHVHAGNQWQSLILPVLAKSLAMEEQDIVIHQYFLGGGYGRRLWGDYMIPAAHASKLIGRPVKLVFPRAEDTRIDCARSVSVQTLTASFDRQKTLTAIEHTAAAGWPTDAMSSFLMLDGVAGENKYDPFSISGADHWYTLPNHRVRAIKNDLVHQTTLPGWLRGVGPGWIGWGLESFMDEVADLIEQDPIEFRLSLLDAAGENRGSFPASVGGAKRLVSVLQDVRQRSRWGQKLPTGEGLGVAVCQGQERRMPTWIACVAHVAVDASGNITVKKIWQSIDCGTVIDPDGALAQAEGATLWGVSLALHEGTAFQSGEVRDSNLDTYSPLRMSDVPDLEIHFMQSDEFPTGLGEPPSLPVPPAIGNAVYAATGKRARSLPIRL